MRLSDLSGVIKGGMGSAIPNAPYPQTLPEGCALPAIAYVEAGGSGTPTFDTPGPHRWRVQFDVVAETYLAAESVRSQLISFLDGWSGVLADGTEMQYIEFIGPIGGFDNVSRRYRCGAQFYLYFNL